MALNDNSNLDTLSVEKELDEIIQAEPAQFAIAVDRQALPKAFWNATGAEYRRDLCVHQLFEQQAAKTPKSPAIEYCDQVLSFETLNRQANSLARYLVQLGVGPDVLVALCVPRCPEMVVALLAILKAGGAYVPVDPAYPAERIGFMVEDSGCKVIVTHSSVGYLLPKSTAQTVYLDTYWPEIEQVESPDLEPRAGPHNLIYVIYTSGSTGLPKGVLIEHRGVVNYLTWCIEEYQAWDGAGAPVHSPLGFDLTVTSLFAPLIAGRPVNLLPEGHGVDDLASTLCERRNYSLVKLTPAHLELLSHSVPSSLAAEATRSFIIGGEQLTAETLAFWRRHAPNTRLINEYGPTETVVGCCTFEVPNDYPDSGPVLIGKPISNTRLYILDEQMEQLEVGQIGELYIGGDGVARGYHNRPKLTQTKFVKDPFVGPEGGRLYRTGDLARYQPDGNIEFLGRIDDQIKIRGFRIEPGEVESVMESCVGVLKALVMARDDGTGDRRLIGYYSAEPDTGPTVRTLQDHIRLNLPDYMVPERLLRVRDFPINENGKIDRIGLPAPEQVRSAEADHRVEPRNDTEKRLVEIWERVLNIRPIGITDDFFELGANSLTAARLTGEIQAKFGTKLPVAPLFHASTIERMAQLLVRPRPSGNWTSLVPIQPEGSRPPLFCVHGGAGTILHFYDLARRLGKNQPFYGLQAQGLQGDRPPIFGVRAMAEHYIKEIRHVQPSGPYYLSGFCFGGTVAFEMAQQLLARNEEVALLALINSPSPAYSVRLINERHGRSESETAEVRSAVTEKIDGARSRGALSYLGARIHHSIDWRLKERRSKAIVPRFRRIITKGLHIPVADTDMFFRTTCYWAERDYAPVPYSGKLLIFRSPHIYPEPMLEWDGLAQDGIEVMDINGQHKHYRDVMDEPLVRTIAARLEKDISASLSSSAI